jgi:antitoxin component YwqK of YwqJK toxin-antitoxin module
MKISTVLIAIVFGFLTTSLSAQETIWFDSNWNPSEKETATYYRSIPKAQNNGFWIVDYYMDGTKQMEGFSFNKSVNKEKFDGLVTYYFSDGVTYQEVNYTSGKIDGIRKIYFKSGELKDEREYEDGKMEEKFSEYYETGELAVRGNYDNNLKEGVWKTYYKNGKIKERGKYEKGEKIGIWKTFYKNVYKK